MGTSMGGMQTWLWGERHPDFADALMPLARTQPGLAACHHRRHTLRPLTGAAGDYLSQPPSLRTAAEVLYFMSSNPPLRQQQMPTLAKSDSALDAAVQSLTQSSDANDMLYQLDASRDYDPGPDLEKIRVPLIAVNSADDLINPPELGILEREIRRVPNGRAVVVPLSPDTRGHGTHTVAAVWKQYLEELLAASDRAN